MNTQNAIRSCLLGFSFDPTTFIEIPVYNARHHLLFAAEPRWVLSEYNSFDHFLYIEILRAKRVTTLNNTVIKVVKGSLPKQSV